MQTAVLVVLYAGFTAIGVLTLAGVITFSGWGEGTLASRLVCGGLYMVVGLPALVAAVVTLIDGRMPVSSETEYSGPGAENMHLVGGETWGTIRKPQEYSEL
ncbi:hypothetical protein CA850_20965 [Micromonospora echinospora]|uniref:hypothetical protein n=1 Tax=Micromonospora echinospora TaxID=1877 RepID=UPI000B5AEDB9|nr:hypothetical protein [Micromonospora echinospora]OZV77875.1 hypothetical protein CA850_20965 [Micromonospora echinospora]